eukprot:TRINITY_DN2857_c0_g1_i1.p1 TRINITY_DN2857_c0_g1~~TRINITY_DN2857_c0_g1_i1.p1  ORF type:complete len:255 (-),score=-16.52 TRINITY_DN2857_c0_g1_i1:12-776(-)
MQEINQKNFKNYSLKTYFFTQKESDFRKQIVQVGRYMSKNNQQDLFNNSQTIVTESTKKQKKSKDQNFCQTENYILEITLAYKFTNSIIICIAPIQTVFRKVKMSSILKVNKNKIKVITIDLVKLFVYSPARKNYLVLPKSKKKKNKKTCTNCNCKKKPLWNTAIIRFQPLTCNIFQIFYKYFQFFDIFTLKKSHYCTFLEQLLQCQKMCIAILALGISCAKMRSFFNIENQVQQERHIVKVHRYLCMRVGGVP